MTVSKAELKNIKALNTKKGRKEQNKIAVGGVRLLEEALKSKIKPLNIYFSVSSISPRAGILVEKFKKTGTIVTGVSNKELKIMSDTESPQGVVAIFKVPEVQLSKLYKPSYRRVLLCDRINDPGNLGTLARSAMAFGFEMMMATDKSAELFSPKVVRSSAGALFSLPASKVSIPELEKFKFSTNAKILAAVIMADSTILDIKKIDSILKQKAPLILAIGGEAEGLSDEVLNITDLKISISHKSNVESLNAAVAGSILMSKIFQRDSQ